MVGEGGGRSTARRETASLVANELVTRLVHAVRHQRPGLPPLQPTIFIPLRRGEILTWKHVVARRV